ncbi:MAG: hypothetical protein FWD23_07305, partial [Oscillospiraceae bacterium]|nr:hypothetical protein [Oscillospiraceae bacterium]
GNDNLNIAAQSLVVEASAVIAAETDKADYPGVGMNIVQGIIDGVTSKSSDLYNTMVNLAQNTLQAMQDALEIASPSAAFRDKVGGNIAEGVADGINKKADKAAKAAKNLAKQSYDAAVLWIKDYRNSADYLLAEEARMWDELAQQYAKGSKQRIDAETEARKVREKMQKEESKAQKDAAKEAQNLLKEREKAQKEAAKAAADALKAQEKAQKEFYDNAKLQIADYQNGVDYSIAEEIKMWESLGENYREVSKEKVEVDKTINKLREDLRKEEEAAVKKYNEETFNNSKIWIDMQKSLNMLSAQEEIEAWERVSERYEEGTKQREEADKNLAKARQDLRDAEKKAISEMEKLEENYQKSLEDRSKALFDTFKLFGEVSLQETNIDKNKKAFENSQKTYDNLTNSMGDLEDKATKAASALNKALGKIDKDAKVAAAALQETIAAVSGEMNSAENLTDKKRSDLLKKQADAQKKYDKTMETLREKRSDAEAKYSEEMETIGAKQIDTLEKLIEAQEKLTAATEETQKSQAQITSENLAAQIAEMAKWGDNMKKLAGKGLDEGFLAELRKMGPSANSYLDELLNSSDDDLNKLSELYQEKYRLAKDLAVDELEELRLETNDKIGVLLDELQKTMSSETNPIGVNMIQGIIEGLNESSGALYNTLTSIMLSSVEVAQSVLQISSPSRVFERIGSFTGEGFIEGIKGMASKVQSVVSKVFGGFDVADIQTDLHMDRNISDFSAVSEFSGGANESLLRELIDSQDELTDAIRGNKPQNGQSSPVIELDGNVLGRVFEPIMERQNNLRGNRMSRTAVRT